ncbi:BspA family leucine-rich repeat surface protein [Colwellia sp. Arc7-D]|uniref:BspA family leucine-rich repeat surface protein n=1 Tax=Colwellia sp. Arc7-D TaxID=2161872 RepID=UPI0013A57FF2|nr:BspA family leucine-rich repeat surface protein [Colwellia sp. Arc7-D]
MTVNQIVPADDSFTVPSSYQLDIIDLPASFIEPISLTLNTQTDSTSTKIFYYDNTLGLQPVPDSMIDNLDATNDSITVKATVQELMGLQSEEISTLSQKVSFNKSPYITNSSLTSSNILSSILFVIANTETSKALYERFFTKENLSPNFKFDFSSTTGSRAINLGSNPSYTIGSHIEESGVLINTTGAIVFSPNVNVNNYSLTLYFDRIDKEGVLLSQENTESLGNYNYIFIDQPSNKPTAVTLVKQDSQFTIYLNGKPYQQREALEGIPEYSAFMPITIGKPLSNCDANNDTTSCLNNKQLEGVLLEIEFYEHALSQAGVRKTVNGKYNEWMSDTDTDSDTLLDVDELLGFVIYDEGNIVQTNYLLADSDSDSLNDNDELQGWLNIGSNSPSSLTTGKSQKTSTLNSHSGDIDYCDGPFLSSACISYLKTYKKVSDPLTDDSDKDGISDADEYFLGTNSNSKDSDNDGLLDKQELYLETDPSDPDTDGDGLMDGMEYYLSGEVAFPNLGDDGVVDLGLDPTTPNVIDTYEGIEEIELTINYLLEKQTDGIFSEIFNKASIAIWSSQLEKVKQLGMNNFTLRSHFHNGYGTNEFKYINFNNYSDQLALYNKAISRADLFTEYKITHIGYGLKKGSAFEAKNSYQAIGQITGMFAAFAPIADIPLTARDLTANLIYGRFDDAVLDLVSLIPAGGDAAKIYAKIIPLIKKFRNNKRFANVIIKLLSEYASKFTNTQKISIMATLIGADVLDALMYEGASSSVSNTTSLERNAIQLSNEFNTSAAPLRFTIDEVIAIAKGVDVKKLKNLLDDDSIEVVKAPPLAPDVGAFNGVFHRSLLNEHWKNAQDFVESVIKESGAVTKQEVTMTPPKGKKYINGKEAGELVNKRRDDIVVDKGDVYKNSDGTQSIDVDTHEVKAGPMSYSKEIRKEVEKDCLRLNAKGRNDQFTRMDKSGGTTFVNVENVTWHFTASGKTSKKVVLGASKPLLEALKCKKYGGKAIKVKAYLPTPKSTSAKSSNQTSKIAKAVFITKDINVGDAPLNNSQSTSSFINTPIQLDISFGYRELLDSDGDGYDDAIDVFPNDIRYHLDTDNDGMADAWEVLYGLDPNDDTDKDLDPDNDELSSLAEFELTLELGSDYSGYHPTRASPKVPQAKTINIQVGGSYQFPLAPIVTWSGKDESFEAYLLTETMSDGLSPLGADEFNHFGLKVDETVTQGTQLTLTYRIQLTTGELTNLASLTVNTSIIDANEKPFIFTVKIEDGNSVQFYTNNEYTYNYSIDWGDGYKSTNLTSDTSHTYESNGEYELTVTGLLPSVHFNISYPESQCYISEVTQWGSNRWVSMQSMFNGCHSLSIKAQDEPDLSLVTNMDGMFVDATSFNDDISTWNVSNVTTMYFMFAKAISFNQDISTWDVSNVTNMGIMFDNAISFNQDISNWDVSNVTNMGTMFNNAISFNQDISTWDVSNVTNMGFMFYNAMSFNQDISTWDVSNVTNMGSMFYNATSFNQDISTWDVSKVTYMGYMFSGASAFNQDISAWDVSNVTSMRWTFSGASLFNRDISAWDVSKVTDMDYMFSGASAFNQDISAWDVSNVTSMRDTFSGASAFNQDISAWDVSNVTSMIWTFSGASSFNQDISRWNVGNVTSMVAMFRGASEFNQNISGWDVSKVTLMLDMFSGASSFNQSIAAWDVSNVTHINGMFSNAIEFNQDISAWDVSNVTHMSYTFSGASSFNQNLATWDTSNVISMWAMFSGASSFNQNISAWDTSKVTYMDYMFSRTSAFNQDISAWDVSNVTDMSNTFAGATVFNQDISAWDVSNVTDMDYMFSGANAFNQDISMWDVSNVTNMHSTFSGASAFNQDISMWDVSNVTNMGSMFYNAISFNQDISAWDVSHVVDMSYMFWKAESFSANLSSWDVSSVTIYNNFSNGKLIPPIWP